MRKKRIAALVAAVALALFALSRLLMSEEDRIRAVVLEAVEGFNETNASQVLDCLAEDYRERSYGLGRDHIHRVLVHTFFNRRFLHPETKRFLLCADLPPEEIRIAIAEDERSAEATFPLRLLFLREEGPELLWSFRIEARLERVEGEWKIVSTSLETRDGGPPR